jgi:hypothetical protein
LDVTRSQGTGPVNPLGDSAPRIAISCPNGVQINCPADMDVQKLKTLITIENKKSKQFLKKYIEGGYIVND